MNIARPRACLFIAAFTVFMPASVFADWPEKPIRRAVPAQGRRLRPGQRLHADLDARDVPVLPDGRVRSIAAMLDERHDALPDVPTFAEAGYPSMAIRSWGAVVGPAGVPPDIQKKLSDAANESLRMESTKKAIAALGMTGKGIRRMTVRERNYNASETPSNHARSP